MRRRSCPRARGVREGRTRRGRREGGPAGWPDPGPPASSRNGTPGPSVILRGRGPGRDGEAEDPATRSSPSPGSGPRGREHPVSRASERPSCKGVGAGEVLHPPADPRARPSPPGLAQPRPASGKHGSEPCALISSLLCPRPPESGHGLGLVQRPRHHPPRRRRPPDPWRLPPPPAPLGALTRCIVIPGWVLWGL